MSYSSKLPGSSSTLKPLARGQPALGMLRCNALLAAAQARRLAPLFELFDRRCQFGRIVPI